MLSSAAYCAANTLPCQVPAMCENMNGCKSVRHSRGDAVLRQALGPASFQQELTSIYELD